MSDSSSEALGANALPAGESDRIRSLIETWTTDLVEGRIAEWERFWSEDAVLMPANHARVVGRGNIVDYVTREFGQIGGYRFSEWSYAGQDDLAVVANQIELETGDDGGAPSAAFNQMMVLRRATDQSWRIQAVIFTPTG